MAPIDETQTKHFCQPVPKQSGEGEREKTKVAAKLFALHANEKNEGECHKNLK